MYGKAQQHCVDGFIGTDHRFRMALIWQAAALTDTGQVRSNNEDTVFISADGHIAIVADGMGGANAGEVASAMAVTALQQVLSPVTPDSPIAETLDRLHEGVELAHAHIIARALDDPACRGMGCTVVIAVLLRERLLHMHVGDSRLYRWRAGDLLQLTRDHSLVQQLFEQGLLTAEEKRLSSKKNIILRALGNDLGSDLDHGDSDLQAGDQFLLCSDGLTDMLDDNDIARLLAQTSLHVGQIAQQLVDAANDKGGRDNISVAIIRAVSL
jgi:PPM family protein phosphatase